LAFISRGAGSAQQLASEVFSSFYCGASADVLAVGQVPVLPWLAQAAGAEEQGIEMRIDRRIVRVLALEQRRSRMS
jgi:hypothetical protein